MSSDDFNAKMETLLSRTARSLLADHDVDLTDADLANVPNVARKARAALDVAQQLADQHAWLRGRCDCNLCVAMREFNEVAGG